ncbi:ankyrin repeat-containing domain protein [Aspergillus pseudoustus]|uniref:Ankyrin repeat-containing domain protein n=1 Tax=Aspergillus pseudoustus TaxID=1810923 RepID=A0ABR4L244_9EURO
MAQPLRAGGLGDLPPEILHLIAQQTNSDRTLNALARTNRYFYQIFNPYLYALNAGRKGRRRGRRSALVWAAKEGREETMRLALQYHNPLRKTKPLVVAVRHNREKIVEMLLAKDGVDIEGLDRENSTPLEVAVASGFEPIVKRLVDAGADVHPRKTIARMRFNGGDSLLFTAIREGYAGVARHLIRSGRLDLNAAIRGHNTALTAATWFAREQVIEDLLVAGANPNIATPLNMAIRKKNAPIIRLLLKHGANPNEPDSRNETPIYRVINVACAESLQALLDCERVDVNHSDILNNTPLVHAVNRGQPNLARLLLSRSETDVNRGLPFRPAVRKGYTELVQAFLDTNRLTGVSMNEGLQAAIDENNLDMTRLLLSREYIDVNSELPFRRAIQHGHIEIARALLDDGRLDQKSKLEGLVAAIQRNEWNTSTFIRAILDSGVNQDEKKDGKNILQTLLEEAYSSQNLKAVAILEGETETETLAASQVIRSDTNAIVLPRRFRWIWQWARGIRSNKRTGKIA